MSLRVRLFLILSGLVLVLVLAQWWWVEALTRELSSEVDAVALRVGNSVAESLAGSGGDASCVGDDCGAVFVHKRIVRRGSRADVIEDRPERVAVGATPSLPSAGAEPPIRIFRTEDDRSTASGTETGADGGFAYSVGLEPSESAVWTEERYEIADADGVRRHLVLRVHTAGDHDVEPSPTLVRHIPIDQAGVESRLDRFSRRLLLGSAGLLALGLLSAAFLAHRVSSPLRQLATTAGRLGRGELGTQVEVRRPTPEVGQAVAAFNRMSRQLAELDARSRALQARQHLGEIGEIGRGLAHTLRNPLNALGLSVDELAGRAPADAETAELAVSARRQIRRIDHAIRSFLALASQGGGAASAVDVAALAHDVALEALQDGGGRVTVEVDAGDAPLPALLAVEPELRAVLQALVVNAVEASDDGAAVAVRLRPVDGGEGVEVEVLDRGPGLPAAVRERLFEPHLSTKAHGSGMGLFLAQRIAATRYGGGVELHDRDGGGTRAVLRLGPRREIADG